MKKFKHFGLRERIIIEQALNEKKSLSETADSLNCHPSSVSREIRNRFIVMETGAYGRNFNNCLNRHDCTNRNNCRCSAYQEETCPLLSRPPYVCNGCSLKRRCTLRKHLYKAPKAHDEYRLILVETRSGIDIDENELSRIDSIISPLIPALSLMLLILDLFLNIFNIFTQFANSTPLTVIFGYSFPLPKSVLLYSITVILATTKNQSFIIL